MASSNSERRAAKRITERLPVTVRTGPGQAPATGYTRDLSTSGIFLYTNAPLQPGAELEMVLILPPALTQGQKRWVCCQAQVVRVEPASAVAELGVAASIRSLQMLPEIPE